MKTPAMETERLLLRPLRVSDAQQVYSGWASDPDVAHFMIWELHEKIEDTVEWLTDEERNLNSDTAYVWGYLLKATGLLIGSGGLCYMEDKGIFELGYNLKKDCWGKGLATEAGEAILSYGKNVLLQKRFFCRHAKENIGSMRVIQKLGFKYTNDGSYTSRTGKKTMIAWIIFWRCSSKTQ